VTALSLAVLLAVSSRSPGPPPQSGRIVFVSAAPIPAGAPIVPQAVRMQALPPERVPAGAVSTPDRLAGRAAKRPIPAGEVITEDMLVPVEEALGVAALLPDGLQAFTVVLPQVDAVMGRIARGNRVDVLATFQQPAPATKVLARNVGVIDVQTIEVQAPPTTSPGGPQPQQTVKALAVTLAVPPDSIPGIVLGQHAGRLALVVYPARAPEETAAGGSVDGASIPALVQALMPAEKKQESREPAPAARAAYTPPPPPPAPTLQVPPLPSQAVERPAPAPGTKPEQKPAPARQEKKTGPAGRRVEVIRGSQVRVEVVPGRDEQPSEESAATRSRQEAPSTAVLQVQPGPVPGTPPPPPQVPEEVNR